jgi:CheY-like chemotaxis protein
MSSPGGDGEMDAPDLNLDEIIASQVDTESIAGRTVILATSHDEEREEFTGLFETRMRLKVYQAPSGQQAVQLAEDTQPDVLVTDSQLRDMHVWQVLNKLRVIGILRGFPYRVTTSLPSARLSQSRYLTAWWQCACAACGRY